MIFGLAVSASWLPELGTETESFVIIGLLCFSSLLLDQSGPGYEDNVLPPRTVASTDAGLVISKPVTIISYMTRPGDQCGLDGRREDAGP